MRDKLIYGAGAGFIGAGVMTVLIFLLNMIPGISIELFERVATLFVAGIGIKSTAGQIIGIIGHSVCGSLVGIGLVAVLDYFGADYPILKGTAAGFVIWFTLCGVLSRFLGIQLEDNFIDALLLMLIHVPFGITSVWLIHKWRLTDLR